MTKTWFRAAVCLLSLSLPIPAHAWGFTGHRLIMTRALDLLPPELKPLFDRHRAEVVMRVVDPDLWRNVGWEDDPNHFVNFGAPELGPFPYVAFPREFGTALEKFGISAL